MRNRFARRCCLANSILFITTIIALASVINTPPNLLTSTFSRNDLNYPALGSDPAKGTFDAIEDTSITKSLFTNDNPGDILTTNINPNDNITNENGNVINSAIESSTPIVSSNSTKNATETEAHVLALM